MRDITKYPPVHPEDDITMLIRHVVKEKKGKLITEGNESFIQRMRNDWDRMAREGMVGGKISKA